MKKVDFTPAGRAWLASLPSAGRSPRTVATYARAVELFGDFLRRDLSAGIGSGGAGEDVTPATVAAFRADCSAAGLSAASVRLYLAALGAFFAAAIRDGIEEKNPATAAEKPPRQRPRLDLLGADEIRALLRQRVPVPGMTRRTFARDRAIVVLLISAGLRNSELRDLRLCDLHDDSGTITIINGKGGKAREIAFPAVAREAVAEYLKSGIRPDYAGLTGCLFGTDADEGGHQTGGDVWHPISAPGLLGLVKRYVAAVVGHGGIGVHDLRHAYASTAAEMGVPITYISRSMGHSSTAITQAVYIDILDQSHAAQVVGSAFDAAFC